MDISKVFPEILEIENTKKVIEAKDVTLKGESQEYQQITIFDILEEDKNDEIVESLGERQKLVYNTLKRYDNGATAKELAVQLHQEGKTAFNERNAVHPRLNELVALGLVETIGMKTCQFTDRLVTVYKVK